MSKLRQIQDPLLTPNSGKRGTCAICGLYSDLTANHIPPASCGNSGVWYAQSLITSASANRIGHTSRKFPNGINFRTLCASCNNGLGAREDHVLAEFYRAASRIQNSKLLLPFGQSIDTQPNILYRSVIAHLLSANDDSVPSAFEIQAREIIQRPNINRTSALNIYYWLYSGDDLTIIRDAMITDLDQPNSSHFAQMLKLKPLAFLIADAAYSGLPNLREHLRSDYNSFSTIPIGSTQDKDSFWPVFGPPWRVVLVGASSSLRAVRTHNRRPARLR